MVLEKVKTIIADTLNCEESEITLTSNITEDFWCRFAGDG